MWEVDRSATGQGELGGTVESIRWRFQGRRRRGEIAGQETVFGLATESGFRELVNRKARDVPPLGVDSAEFPFSAPFLLIPSRVGTARS